MGVALALAAMVCFAANILVTRFALARLPLDSGFFVVLATNVGFPAMIFATQAGLGREPVAWNWTGAGIFALGGVIGTFLGRRMLFDTVRLLGPARASVYHSTSPAFALLFAWLMVGERLGWFEILLMAVVWTGLWFTQPRGGGSPKSLAILRQGMLAGVFTVAFFALGNVLRGMAIREWHEAVLGTFIASLAALACQVIATRDWRKIGTQLRGASRTALLLYGLCGVTTTLGSVLITLAMNRMEIALAVLVVHTTPLVIFPVSVFLLKNREELNARTLLGTAIVFAGIGLLAIR